MFILSYVIPLFLPVENPDELLSHEPYSDSSDLDFEFSSDECPEVPEFHVDSPELQGIPSTFYLK